MTGFVPATLAIAGREIRRFHRQKGRLIGAVATPLLFWALLASGFGRSLVVGGAGASAFFYPGTVLLSVLFTAVFASLPVIEDRREGFLRAALATPASRVALMLGLSLGGGAVAWGQAAVLLAPAGWLGLPVTIGGYLGAVAVAALLALACAALGMAAAWRAESSQAYHAVMNVVLVPGWLFSGAVFPGDGAAGWVRWCMMANPLTYGLTALRQCLGDPAAATGVGFAALPVNLAILVVFAAASVAWAALEAGRPEGGPA